MSILQELLAAPEPITCITTHKERAMKLLPIKTARLEYLARHPNPLKMGTHISYNEIAAMVAELYEMRRKFGRLRHPDLELPVSGLCMECREDIVDGVCRCFPEAEGARRG